MTYGQLTVICGPMFAGKTTELLKRILWAKNGLNEPVAVYKSGYDTRYRITEIASHDGLHASAAVITEWASTLPEATHVFFDEVHFFTQPYFTGDVVSIIRSLLQQGKNVTVTGIDADWQGAAFDITGRLAAMADDVVKLRSHCAVCGRPATKTFRREKGGSAIELGGTETYEPRCNAHWNSYTEATLFNQNPDEQEVEAAVTAPQERVA